MKPKYSEGPRDWYNLFAIKRFRYGEVLFHIINIVLYVFVIPRTLLYRSRGAGGALGYLLGGYVPPGTPNWHPVLKKISPKIDTPF